MAIVNIIKGPNTGLNSIVFYLPSILFLDLETCIRQRGMGTWPSLSGLFEESMEGQFPLQMRQLVVDLVRQGGTNRISLVMQSVVPRGFQRQHRPRFQHPS